MKENVRAAPVHIRIHHVRLPRTVRLSWSYPSTPYKTWLIGETPSSACFHRYQGLRPQLCVIGLLDIIKRLLGHACIIVSTLACKNAHVTYARSTRRRQSGNDRILSRGPTCINRCVYLIIVQCTHGHCSN